MASKKSISEALTLPKGFSPIPRLSQTICAAAFKLLIGLSGIQPSTWQPDKHYHLIRPRCPGCLSDLSAFKLKCEACLREMFRTYDHCTCETCNKSSPQYQKFLDQLASRYACLNFGDRYTLEWVVATTKSILRDKEMEEIAKDRRLKELSDDISERISEHSHCSLKQRETILYEISDRLCHDTISSVKDQFCKEVNSYLELNPVLKDDAKRRFPGSPLVKCRQIPYMGPDVISKQKKTVSYFGRVMVRMFDEDQLHPDTRDLESRSRYEAFDFMDRRTLYKAYLRQLPSGQKLSIEDWWASRNEKDDLYD